MGKLAKSVSMIVEGLASYSNLRHLISYQITCELTG